MKIKIDAIITASPDGVRRITYNAGDEYEIPSRNMPAHLAAYLVSEGNGHYVGGMLSATHTDLTDNIETRGMTE